MMSKSAASLRLPSALTAEQQSAQTVARGAADNHSASIAATTMSQMNASARLSRPNVTHCSAIKRVDRGDAMKKKNALAQIKDFLDAQSILPQTTRCPQCNSTLLATEGAFFFWRGGKKAWTIPLSFCPNCELKFEQKDRLAA
jgi:hypothetical protein